MSVLLPSRDVSALASGSVYCFPPPHFFVCVSLFRLPYLVMSATRSGGSTMHARAGMLTICPSKANNEACMGSPFTEHA